MKVESNVSSATTSRSSSPEQKELVIDDWVNTSKSEFVLMDGEGVRDLGLQISHVSGGGSMIKEFSTEIGKEFSKDPLPMPSSSEDQEPQENK